MGESRTTKRDGNDLGVPDAMKWAAENRARFDIDSALGVKLPRFERAGLELLAHPGVHCKAPAVQG